MKARICTLLLLLMMGAEGLSQVAVNTDGANPDASAMLDVKSTSKGVLVPRMTAAQRAGITTPATGLMVYQTDGSAGFYYYTGSGWQWLGGSNLTGLGTNGLVPFWTGTYSLGSSANLFWDNTNSRLGLGTTTPNQQLELTGNIRLDTTGTAKGIIYARNSRFIHNWGYRNTFVGEDAGNISMSGANNAAFGYNAMNSNVSGYGNTGLGVNALQSNLSGYNNTGIGFNSLYRNFGDYNTAVGLGSMENADGDQNTVVGSKAGFGVQFVSDYSRNVLLGYQSGMALTIGSNNILIGYQAGDNLTTGSNNIILGYDINAPYAMMNHQMVLGADDVLYGDLLNKKVGIGTTSPGQKLTVNGTLGILETGASPTYHTIIQGGDQSTNVTYTLPPSAGIVSGQALTTDGNGVLSWTTVGNLSGTGTATRVAFWNNTSTLSSSSNLFWDNSNNRLGIGTSSPVQQLDLTANIRLDTTGTSKGIIYARSSTFLHNYGYGNTFLGESAGNLTMTGTLNSGTGLNALANTTTGASNVAVGANVLRYNESGQRNTAIGSYSLNSNQSGSYNTAVGGNALLNLEPGSSNTAVGYQAGAGLSGNSFSNNSLFGYYAGLFLTSGSNNILMGYQAGLNLTTGSNNIIIGYNLNAPNATGNNQVVIGASDLFYGDLANKRIGIGTVYPDQQLELTGSVKLPVNSNGTNGIIFKGSNRFLHDFKPASNDGYNTFLGNNAGNFSMSGTNSYEASYNTGMGANALTSLSTGYSNTAVGSSALYSNSEGTGNTAMGRHALASNSTGSENTGLGRYAGYFNSIGDSNTVVGYQAGYGSSGQSYSRNSLFGDRAGSALTSGSNNVLVGERTGNTLTTGANNTIIGSNADVSSNSLTNTSVLGYNTTATSSNQVRLGNSSVTSFYCMGAYNGAVGATYEVLHVDNTGKIGYATSSLRYKKNIHSMEPVDWLYKLRPVNFIYKEDQTGKKQYGLIAEEVLEVNPSLVRINTEGLPESVNYSELITPLLKAIQDQQKEIEELKKDRDLLLKKLEDLENRFPR